MKRTSSLIPVAWICLSSPSSRALQVTTTGSARPNSFIRSKLLITSPVHTHHKRRSASSVVRLMSSKSDEERPRRKRTVRGSEKDVPDVPKKKSKGGGAKTKEEEVDDNHVDEESPPKEAKKPRAKAVKHQIFTERDELPKLWNAAEHEDSSFSK